MFDCFNLKKKNNKYDFQRYEKQPNRKHITY